MPGDVASGPRHQALACLSDAEWPAGLARLREDFAGKLNVYRVMAHHPELLAAWETLRNHVVLNSALSPQQRELAILRTAHHWNSRYELGQHVVRGRQAGLTDAQIGLACGDTALPSPGPDGAMIDYVDHLLLHARLPAARVTDILAELGAKKILDLIVTVGMYTTLAGIANSFQVPLEPETHAALLAAPLAPAVENTISDLPFSR